MAVTQQALPISGVPLAPTDQWLDSNEAALFLHMSRRSLTRYTHARKIPVTKYDGKNLYRRSDLERFQQRRLIPAE